ncbi:hypothetical protein PGB28_12540 [Primorskyibacter aestuariivivens]|uniref:COG3904 family protein n=1 Tax=Primorskyibacter aestuariivivens TaxID=1888912 RepID=UPI002301A142|nr:hypothetical protein [Primorskyibacter aestuariivivens]MDA7429291.1 hypothetical protein [Primorskyibacter aestuariivivens]
MKLMHWLVSAVIGSGVFLGFGQVAEAAEINAYDDPYMGCIVKIEGVIQPGDAKVLERVLKAELIRRGARGDRFEYMNENGHRICLDSPGGSFSEGLRMAELIQGAMGTAVPRGARCESACAVVFMAGSQSTESDAGVVANRKLHAGARLGFHAPSLEVAEGAYSEAQVNKAYKIAVFGLGQLMARMSDMKLSQTLIAEMLKTPPEEMFYVDTVHKAGRWLIPVVGTVRPSEITPLAVSNACNSYYAWTGDRLATNGFGFDPDPAQRWGWSPQISNRSGRIEAVMDGFGQEGSLNCKLYVDPAAGANDADGLWGQYASIRMGEDGIGFEASAATFFDPRTPLAALVRPEDANVTTRDVMAHTPTDRSTEQGTCYVFKGSQRLDFDPCGFERSIQVQSNLSERDVSTFTWPSGAKTVVERGGDTKINGREAKTIWSDKPVKGDCWLNIGSGNTFCFEKSAS